MKLSKFLLLSLGACLSTAGSLHAQILISVGGTAVTEDFNSFGTGNTNDLPSHWKGAVSATYKTASFSYATAAITQTSFSDVNSVSRSGLFNLGSGATPSTSTNRALGFWVTSGNYTVSKTAVAMVRLQNSGASSITSLSISYDLGKYRFGNVDSDVDLLFSVDGVSWIVAGGSFVTHFALDSTTNLISSNTPRDPVTVNGTSFLPTEIASGGNFYLAWRYSSNITSNTPTAMGAAIGLDNISITAIPEPATALFAIPAFALLAFHRRRTGRASA